MFVFFLIEKTLVERVCISQGPPEKQNNIYIERDQEIQRQRKIYFKELVYVTVKAVNSKVCRVG